MRLPNGFGTVYKLTGKRRRPYIARKAVGHDERGRRIFTVIGYFANRNDAIQALAQYSAAPYDVEAGRQKFSDIYEQWFKQFIERSDTSESSITNYRWAYNSVPSLHEMKMSDVRPAHMQEALVQYTSYARQRKILLLYHRLYEFCIERDYLTKDYSKSVHRTISASTEKERNPFTKEEVDTIWQLYEKNHSFGAVLILLYTGLRIGEFLDLRSEDVNIDKQYFRVRKSKTKAGERIVPIADKILPIFKEYLAANKSHAFTTITGVAFQYSTFRKEYWNKLMTVANINHTIHETRHTFITNLTMKNVNHTIIKKLAGHKSDMDLTERVYTHTNESYIKELLSAVNLLD